MKTNKRQERRDVSEKKKETFNQSAKKGMTPYKSRKPKHKNEDLFAHLDAVLKY